MKIFQKSLADVCLARVFLVRAFFVTGQMIRFLCTRCFTPKYKKNVKFTEPARSKEPDYLSELSGIFCNRIFHFKIEILEVILLKKLFLSQHFGFKNTARSCSPRFSLSVSSVASRSRITWRGEYKVAISVFYSRYL